MTEEQRHRARRRRDEVGGVGADHGYEPKRCGNGAQTHHAQGQDAYRNRAKREGDASRTAATEGVKEGPRTAFARAHQTHTAVA